MHKNKIPTYKVVLWLTLVACLVILWRLSPILTDPILIPSDDFVRHWAAGRLVMTGGDPYSPTEIQVFQNLATRNQVISPVITPNYIPPWVMLVLALFSLPSYGLSRILWLLFNCLILLISSEMIWRVYDGPSNRKWVAWIACLVFAPTISILEKGQTTCLALLGLAGFLFFLSKRSNLWIAGAFGCLITVKPQLFYLLWLVLFLWSVDQKEYRLILSLLVTFILATCAVMILDPAIVRQYIDAVINYPPTMFQTPTIGGYLRYFIFGPEQFWLQYVPLPFGVAWLFYHYMKYRKEWNWLEQTPRLLLVSFLTSFYSWTYDLVLLAPVVIQAWVWIGRIQKRWLAGILLVIYFVITLTNLIQHRYADDFWFLWFTPVVMSWYVWVWYHAHHSKIRTEKPA